MGAHHHGHSHSHSHGTNVNKKSLILALIVIGGWMVVELIGGLWTGSLALLADAGHMFSDFFNLFISLAAMIAAGRAVSKRKTFGNHRYEILAALFNGAALLVIAVFIVSEAVQRAGTTQEIMGGPMIIIAVVGLIANILCLYILSGGEIKENLNMKGAFLHVIGDTLGSVGAIIAGLSIYFFNWYAMDLILSAGIAALIGVAGWNLCKESIHILVEGAPAHVDCDEVKAELEKIPGVLAVHDMHVWTITSGLYSFTCHIVVEEHFRLKGQDVLVEANRWIYDNLGIEHSTIQIEYEDLRHLEHSTV